jgi:DMSO/TMAO reductase YedYZ heme-binding membrane subunit
MVVHFLFKKKNGLISVVLYKMIFTVMFRAQTRGGLTNVLFF